MRFFANLTGLPFRSRSATWVLSTLFALASANPVRAFGQQSSPVGVVRAASAPRTQYITARSPGQGPKVHCVLFGIASGAVLGAGVAYVYIHTGLAGPDEGARPYRFFVPSGAAFGGIFAAVGRWPGPGGC